MSFKEVKRQIFPGTFAHENNPKRDGAFNEFKHTSYTKDSTVFSEKKKKSLLHLEVNRYLLQKRLE